MRNPKIRHRPWLLLVGLLLLFAPAIPQTTGATSAARPEAPVDLWWTEQVDTSRHFSLRACLKS